MNRKHDILAVHCDVYWEELALYVDVNLDVTV